MIQCIAPFRLDNAYRPLTPAPHDLVLDVSAEGLLLHADLRLPELRAWRNAFPGSGADLRYAFRFTRENDPAPEDAGSAEASESAAARRMKDVACTMPPSSESAAARTLPGVAGEKRHESAPLFSEAPEQAGPHGQNDPLLRPGARLFLALRPAGEKAVTPEGLRRVPPSALRGVPGPLPLAAFTALHLFRWYDDHRFCGRCGSALRHAPKERALLCPACNHVCYPVIAPCVIVAVTSGDRLLLTRCAGSRSKHFALVAGFTEIGETSEQAAAREVMEETGLRIRHLRYAGSQPWGLSGSLVTGFFAELDGPDEIRLDASELSEARWVRRADIPPCPDAASLTMTMIARFARGEA